jgi:nucleotide-binding universal stress UspA family protein
MNEDVTAIRRILVALDSSPHSMAALKTAVELAANLGARVIGLFVEEANLLRAAELPLALEVGTLSPSPRRLHRHELERHLRAQAGRLRQRMAQLADERGVPWHFRVSRGSVSTELLASSAEADLIIVGKAGRSISGRGYVGSTVRTLILQGRSSTLILQHGQLIRTPVLVIYDGSVTAQKALRVAEVLKHVKDYRLIVLVVAPDRDSAHELRADLLERVEHANTDIHLLVDPDRSRLLRSIAAFGEAPLVLPCGSQGALQGEELCDLMMDVKNPVLLVR